MAWTWALHIYEHANRHVKSSINPGTPQVDPGMRQPTHYELLRSNADFISYYFQEACSCNVDRHFIQFKIRYRVARVRHDHSQAINCSLNKTDATMGTIDGLAAHNQTLGTWA